jgi:hypothetical protein
MKNTINNSERISNNDVDKYETTNTFIDAIIIARELGDIKTENMIIKMLKMQGTRIDWAKRQNN